MAYGIIYKFRAETAKYKSDVKINILKNGYAGASSDKYLGAGGVTLTKDSGGVICGTSLSFTAQADTDFEYLNFFESAPREYLVQLLIDDTIVWQGYLIGDEYREAFRNPPYDVAITATDGLGLLKNYDYTVLATPTTKTTRIGVVREILESTGLNLAISVSYDVVSGATKFFNVEFADDYCAGWTCYDLLEKMIPPDATITQHAGKWLIRRNEQDTAKTHTIYSYVEGSGYIITTGVGETALDLAAMGAGDVYPIGQAELNMQHAWKSMTVTSEHGKRPSFLYNHDFADGLTHWEEGSPTGVAVAVDSDTGSYVQMDGTYNLNSEDVPDAYVKQSFPYTSVEDEGFMISFRYSMTGWIRFGIGGLRPVMLTFKGRVEITDGVDTYYLDETDGWSTTNRNFEKKDTTVISGIEWKEMTIYAESPPIASGTVTVYLYPLNTVVDDPSICFSDVVVRPFVWKNYPNAYEFPVLLQTNATEKAEITILPTSAPNAANYDRMFYNGHSISGARVDSFVSGGNTYTYTNLIINSLKFLHGTTRQLLTGYFRGAGLSLNSLINCAATAGRDYIVESGSWEVLNDKYNLNLLEIPGTATGSSWAVGTTDFASSAGWSDSHSTGGTGGGSSSGGGGVYTGGGGSWLDPYFELVNSGTTGEYLRALRDFASTGEIIAYNAASPTGSFWDNMPVATTGTLGGVIIGSGLAVTELGVLSATGTGSTTGTIDVVDGILDLAVTTGVLSVSPYPAKITPDPGYAYLYGGISNPTFTNRLNLDGILYVTRIYCGIVNTTLDTYLTLNKLYFRNGSKIVTIENGTDFNISTNGTRLGIDSADGIVLNYFGTGYFTGTVAQILGVTSSGELIELAPTTYLTAITKLMVEGVLTGTITSHNHAGTYEPAFSKNTAFNKNFGTTAGTVAEGNDSRLALFSTYFEIINQGQADEYIRAKKTFASVGDIIAYNTASPTGTFWDNLPVATTTILGGVKVDGTTITILNGVISSTGGGGATDHGALSGLADDDHTQYHNDTRGDLRYELKITKATGYLRWTGTAWEFKNEAYSLSSHNHSGVYQPSDSDLTAIAALTGTGIAKRTGVNTWALDSSTYLTAITKDMIEAVLTGAITSHTHAYEAAISKATGYLRWTGTAWEFKNEAYSLSSHNHSGTYEPAFTKNTAFNKNFGSASGTVAEGNDSRFHAHTNAANLAEINQDLATTDDVHFLSADVTSLEVDSIIDGVLQTGYGYNLLRYSNTFDNAAWTKYNCTASDNEVNNPFGGGVIGGCLLEYSGAGPTCIQQVSSNATGNYTFSVWIKGEAAHTMYLRLISNTQTPGSVAISVTTSWQRFYITTNLTSAHTSKYCRIELSNQSISIFGAQLESGTAPTRYINTLGTALSGTGAHVYGGLRVVGAIVASDEVTAFSDSRLKHDITLHPDALSKVREIKVVDYCLNGDRNERRRTGVIAQQLIDIYPQFVEGSENDYYSVNYPKLVSVAIKAIQELSDKVEQLEQKLKDHGINN